MRSKRAFNIKERNMSKGGGSVMVKSYPMNKGAICSPFKDAVASPKGMGSPAPEQNNKSGKK
jgi:hypothetical protein